MKFVIEQVALCPEDPAAAIELLSAMGMSEWAHDNVVARGSVFGKVECTNKAHLAFNYQSLGAAKELEVLNYTDGDNWMDAYAPSVSHLGMHVTEEQLAEWRAFFTARGIKVAQEVFTQSHDNPVIAGKRWYHYVIFDTRAILSTDIKFIVRRDSPQS